jgi:2-phosphosulfolactate phosphatase
MKVDLFLLPGMAREERLKGKTVVLIDVLRASTTICRALFSGARAVIPVEEPGEATDMREKIGPENVILAGERHGIRIENFNLGNSPREFTEDAVRDKVIILTTSNGTRAYARTRQAKLAITAGLVNVSTVAEKIFGDGNDTVILCAGSEGDFSIEDTLCGGMLIDKLESMTEQTLELNDAASLALLLYANNSRTFGAAIARGEHGRTLANIGFAPDVTTATDVDSIPVLPVLKEHRIILESIEQN